jgi:hypothetical protein
MVEWKKKGTLLIGRWSKLSDWTIKIDVCRGWPQWMHIYHLEEVAAGTIGNQLITHKFVDTVLVLAALEKLRKLEQDAENLERRQKEHLTEP